MGPRVEPSGKWGSRKIDGVYLFIQINKESVSHKKASLLYEAEKPCSSTVYLRKEQYAVSGLKMLLAKNCQKKFGWSFL